MQVKTIFKQNKFSESKLTEQNPAKMSVILIFITEKINYSVEWIKLTLSEGINYLTLNDS